MAPLLAATLLGACTVPQFSPKGETDDDTDLSDDDAIDPETITDVSRKDASLDGSSLTLSDAGDRDTRVPPDRDARSDSPPNDATVPRGDAKTPVAEETGVPGTSACLAGIYALRAEADVSWKGSNVSGVFVLVRPGAGKVVFYARVELEGTLNPFPSKIAICGTDLPEFAGGDRVVIDERYGFYIPDASWDQPSMPRPDVAWTLDCEKPGPGCKLATKAPFSGTFGAASFLPPPSPLMFLDHDNDANDGVTVRARLAPEMTADGKPYLPVPLSFGTNARSDTLFAAFHMATSFDGTVKECGHVNGTLRDTTVAIRPAGCRASEDGAPARACTGDEASFLSTNVPSIETKSGTFDAYRIPSDSNCAAVRAYFRKP